MINGKNGGMNLKTIQIRGIPFAAGTMEEAVSSAVQAIKAGKQTVVYTPNAEIAQRCEEDGSFRDILVRGDLILPDGEGVLMASRILGTPIPHKLSGVEFGEAVLSLCAETGYRVFFLGGKPGVAELAAERMKEKYPGLLICGTSDGYFEKTGEENDRKIKEINESSADILFVCLGSPTQEIWTSENRARIGVSLLLCLGGSLDVYSGKVKRAPKFFLRLKLEWFYRLIKEPKRLPRMMKLPRYIFGTIAYKNKKRKEEKKYAR